MRKLLIAALLGGVVAVPAQAATVIELTGSFHGANFDINVSPYAQEYFGGHVVFSGQCFAYCEYRPTANGFSITGFNTNFYAEFSFSFSDGLPPSSSDEIRTGTGTGYMAQGYMNQTVYDFNFTSARIYDDGEPWFTGQEFPTMKVSNYYTYAVPEPATWAMMIGGFALAGAALRRKRYRAAFA